jgi:hypothetical protein
MKLKDISEKPKKSLLFPQKSLFYFLNSPSASFFSLLLTNRKHTPCEKESKTP